MSEPTLEQIAARRRGPKQEPTTDAVMATGLLALRDEFRHHHHQDLAPWELMESEVASCTDRKLADLTRRLDALERATPVCGNCGWETPAREDGPWKCLAEAETQRDAALARAERAERELAEAISTQGTIATARDEYYRRFKDAERKLAEARAERDENYLSKCHTEDECCRIEVECGEATLALKAARASAEKLRLCLERIATSGNWMPELARKWAQFALDQDAS